MSYTKKWTGALLLGVMLAASPLAPGLTTREASAQQGVDDTQRDIRVERANIQRLLSAHHELPDKVFFGRLRPEVIEARHSCFERMRLQLLDTVLEARRELQAAADVAAKEGAQARARGEARSAGGVDSGVLWPLSATKTIQKYLLT